jgi:RND family efflux transporter MFP subunit
MGRENMKKYVLLLAFTVAAAMWVLIIPIIKDIGAVSVNAIEAKYSHISSDVTCSGTVEAASRQSFVYGYPIKLEKVYVKIGDKVTTGQKLADIDKNSTLEALKTLTSASGSYTSGADASSSSQDTSSSSVQQYYDLASKYAEYADGEMSQSDAYNDILSSVDASHSAAVSSDGTILVPDSIYAGINGTVTYIGEADGTYSQSQTPLAVIMNMDTLKVKAQVDENSLSGIKAGQRAKISGPAMSKSKTGKITQIYPSASASLSETGTRKTTVTVIIAIDSDGVIPGLSADVTISTNESDHAVVLPYTAIGEDMSNCKYVYLYSNGKAIKRNISTGREYENSVEVTSGVSRGDLVISGPDSIKKGREKIRLRSVEKS